MKISERLKIFLQKHKEDIDDNNFEEIYNDDNIFMDDYFTMTKLFFSIGINPLKYMSFVPAFYMEDFKDLEEIEIPEGIKEIGKEAFYGCTNLKKVYLPSTLQVIEYAVFGGCGSLKDIYFNGTTEQWSRLLIDENNDNLYYANIHCIDGEPFKV